MSPITVFRKSWESVRGWLALGIGVKRWLGLLAIGSIVAGMGISALIVLSGQSTWFPDGIYRALTLRFLPPAIRVFLPLLIGGAAIVLAIYKLGSNLVAPFRRPGEDVPSLLQNFTTRKRGPRIVAIGGGTGLPNLLQGLTQFTSNITAIVTVADDGGSSGRLRRELGLLPPGDFRNNIAALGRDKALMSQLFQYRFGSALGDTGEGEGPGELAGHAFGNLLLAALTGITGSFEEALEAAGRVLAVQGKVFPSTLANVSLAALVKDRSDNQMKRIVGESEIPGPGRQILRVELEPADVAAYPTAVQAILQADVVVLGPGSLFTSILPNLLIAGINMALQRTKASRLYVCNLATQPGETDNYSVAEHVYAIDQHLRQENSNSRDWVDYIIVNNNWSIPPDTGGGNTVFVKGPYPEGTPLVELDLVDRERPWRHDARKLARAVISFAQNRE